MKHKIIVRKKNDKVLIDIFDEWRVDFGVKRFNPIFLSRDEAKYLLSNLKKIIECR